MGTLEVSGIRVLVENAKGSTRSGVDPDGHAWSVKMHAHYGEIAGTEGTDGEPVDVYVGPDRDAPQAYVVHQKIPGTERHDEDKVMLGFASKGAAIELYRKQYDKPGFYGGCTTWTIDELARWLRRRAARGERLDSPKRVREMVKAVVQVKAHVDAHGHAVKAHLRNIRDAVPHGHDLEHGEQVTLPATQTQGSAVWGDKDEDFTVHHLEDGEAEVHSPDGRTQIRMPRASVSHFVNDQRHTFAEKPDSGNPAIDAVLSGKAERLGKGNDGIAYRVGEQVVKVSTTTPFNPHNRGHRSPAGAVDHLRNEQHAHEALAGVAHVPKTSFSEHDGRGFLIKPFYNPVGKMTPEELGSIDAAVKACHDRGWCLRDQIQLGRDDSGKLWFMDLGSAEHGASSHRMDRDEDYLDDLYRDHGVKREKWLGDEAGESRKLGVAMILHKPGSPRLAAALERWEHHAKKVTNAMETDSDEGFAAWSAKMDEHDAIRAKVKARLEGGEGISLKKGTGGRLMIRALIPLTKSQMSLFGSRAPKPPEKPAEAPAAAGPAPATAPAHVEHAATPHEAPAGTTATPTTTIGQVHVHAHIARDAHGVHMVVDHQRHQKVATLRSDAERHTVGAGGSMAKKPIDHAEIAHRAAQAALASVQDNGAADAEMAAADHVDGSRLWDLVELDLSKEDEQKVKRLAVESLVGYRTAKRPAAPSAPTVSETPGTTWVTVDHAGHRWTWAWGTENLKPYLHKAVNLETGRETAYPDKKDRTASLKAAREAWDAHSEASGAANRAARGVAPAPAKPVHVELSAETYEDMHMREVDTFDPETQGPERAAFVEAHGKAEWFPSLGVHELTLDPKALAYMLSETGPLLNTIDILEDRDKPGKYAKDYEHEEYARERKILTELRKVHKKLVKLAPAPAPAPASTARSEHSVLTSQRMAAAEGRKADAKRAQAPAEDLPPTTATKLQRLKVDVGDTDAILAFAAHPESKAKWLGASGTEGGWEKLQEYARSARAMLD